MPLPTFATLPAALSARWARDPEPRGEPQPVSVEGCDLSHRRSLWGQSVGSLMASSRQIPLTALTPADASGQPNLAVPYGSSAHGLGHTEVLEACSDLVATPTNPDERIRIVPHASPNATELF